MITLEQVEKLREKADVSYEDAKAALELTDGDLLEAVIHLEKQGKIDGPEVGSYNTRTGGARDSFEEEAYFGRKGRKPHHRHGRSYGHEQYEQQYKRQGPTIGQQLHYFWMKFCDLVRKTNANQFEVSRDGRSLISMPVTLLIVSLIFFFWVTLPLLIIALFFGCRYRFTGPDFGRDSINSIMGQAADTADNIKRSVMENEAARKESCDKESCDGEHGGFEIKLKFESDNDNDGDCE
ncbi:MAG: DUF4342 domain-containing protein [Clostridiales bacterium]|nr:DUF4342 domain-containing protein [Clostridiales bacterium]